MSDYEKELPEFLKPYTGIDFNKDFEQFNKDPEYLRELLKLEQEENAYLQKKIKKYRKVMKGILKSLLKGDDLTYVDIEKIEEFLKKEKRHGS